MDTTTTTTTHVTARPAWAGVERVDLETLAHTVATDGVDAHLGRVLGLVLEARELGVDATLVDLLADDHAPVTARERALGLVSVRVDRARRPVPHLADILSA
jgi:hypothetical protein